MAGGRQHAPSDGGRVTPGKKGPGRVPAPDYGAPQNLDGLFGTEAPVNYDLLQEDLAGYLGVTLPEKERSEAEQRDERFGNDMAWLDDAFQQKAPTREEALALGTTGDEVARDKQRGAADELFSLYEQGGLDAQNRNARAKNRRETENMLLGHQQANLQDMAERGMSGSGAELAAMLGGNQAAAQRLSSADLQTSADAEQRALSALLGGTQIESGLQQSADNYVQSNQRLLSEIEAQNVQGRRQAYQQTMANRNNFDLTKLGLQTQAAQGIANRDQGDNQYGFGYSGDLAKDDADAWNASQGQYNNAAQGMYQGYIPAMANAGQTRIDKTGGSAAYGGATASASGKQIMDYAGGIGSMGKK